MNKYKVNPIAGPHDDMEKRALDQIVSQMLSRIGDGIGKGVSAEGADGAIFGKGMASMPDDQKAEINQIMGRSEQDIEEPNMNPNDDPDTLEDDGMDDGLKDLVRKRRRA